MNKVAPERLKSLLTIPRTLVLGRALKNRSWTAPVYFVYGRKGFYFFSNPQSRHICWQGQGASAALFLDSQDSQGILGLQMTGKILPVNGRAERLDMLKAYVTKFHFLKNQLSPGVLTSPRLFREAFNTRPHVFTPLEIWMSDLSGMGRGRQQIPLEVLP